MAQSVAVLSMDEIEKNIENIQPRRSGHSARSLVSRQPLGGLRTTAENKHAEYRQAIAGAPNQTEKVKMWADYLKWVQQQNVHSSSQAIPYFEECLCHNGGDLKMNTNKDNLKYLHLWLKYADIVSDPVKVFDYLYDHEVGCNHVLFYMAYCTVLEKARLYDKAYKMMMGALQIDLHRKEKLEKHYDEFLHRMKSWEKKQKRKSGAESKRSALSSIYSASVDENGNAVPQRSVEKDSSAQSVKVYQGDQDEPAPVPWKTFVPEREERKENTGIATAWAGTTIPQKEASDSMPPPNRIPVFVDPENAAPAPAQGKECEKPKEAEKEKKRHKQSRSSRSSRSVDIAYVSKELLVDDNEQERSIEEARAHIDGHYHRLAIVLMEEEKQRQEAEIGGSDSEMDMSDMDMDQSSFLSETDSPAAPLADHTIGLDLDGELPCEEKEGEYDITLEDLRNTLNLNNARTKIKIQDGSRFASPTMTLRSKQALQEILGWQADATIDNLDVYADELNDDDEAFEGLLQAPVAAPQLSVFCDGDDDDEFDENEIISAPVVPRPVFAPIAVFQDDDNQNDDNQNDDDENKENGEESCQALPFSESRAMRAHPTISVFEDAGEDEGDDEDEEVEEVEYDESIYNTLSSFVSEPYVERAVANFEIYNDGSGDADVSTAPFDPYTREHLSTLCHDEQVQHFIASSPLFIQCDDALPIDSICDESELSLLDISLRVDKTIGEGSYGKVYKVDQLIEPDLDLDDFDLDAEEEESSTRALKVMNDPFCWELYIYERISSLSRSKLSERIINFHSVQQFSNCCCVLMEFGAQGTLGDVVRAYHKKDMKFTDDLAAFFLMRLLSAVSLMHKEQLIHGDIKADNVLVWNDVDGDDWQQWKSDGSASGWTKRGIKLIDFSRSLDMSLYPKDVAFTGDNHNSSHKCIEMREGKPWTYEIDLFGVCAVLHLMLFGKEISVVSNGDRWASVQKARLPEFQAVFDALLHQPNTPSSQKSEVIEELISSLSSYLAKESKKLHQSLMRMNRALSSAKF